MRSARKEEKHRPEPGNSCAGNSVESVGSIGSIGSVDNIGLVGTSGNIGSIESSGNIGSVGAVGSTRCAVEERFPSKPGIPRSSSRPEIPKSPATSPRAARSTRSSSARSARSGKSVKSMHSSKSLKSFRSEKSVKSVKSVKSEKSLKSNKSLKSLKSNKGDKSDKSEKNSTGSNSNSSRGWQFFKRVPSQDFPTSAGNLGDEVLRKRLGKLRFWDKNDAPPSCFDEDLFDAFEKPETVPFPHKESNPGSPTRMRKLADEPRRNRSRSSSLASSLRRRATTASSHASLASHASHTSHTSHASHTSHVSHVSHASHASHVPPDDVRFHKTLPLPPPPTIGIGEVLNDPDVRKLELDPMAVRHADCLHQLGYTRNRYVCALLAKDAVKTGVSYSSNVMQAFLLRMMRFAGEPLDMSLRKLLFCVALPEESQQIERVLHSFSVLWHYDNPSIFQDVDQVLYVVFSLVMLHTDYFNKNVKHKMSKPDYVQYAALDDCVPEIFEYFYDNITAVPFRAEEDLSRPPSPLELSTPPTPRHSSSFSNNSNANFSISTNSGVAMSPSVTSVRGRSASKLTDDAEGAIASLAQPEDGARLDDPLKMPDSYTDDASLRSKRSPSFSWLKDTQMDPYPYILENRIDALRPQLTLPEEPGLVFYRLTRGAYKTICNNTSAGVRLQVVSSKSRPSAYAYFEQPKPTEPFNKTQNANPGVVQVQVIMHGVLKLQETKRTLGGQKPQWKEWGAVLTESHLYLFKNTSWVKQFSHEDGARVSVESLNSAVSFPTVEMAALVRREESARLHEFVLVCASRDVDRRSLAATSAREMRMWVQCINFIGALATMGVSVWTARAFNSVKSDKPRDIKCAEMEKSKNLSQETQVKSESNLESELEPDFDCSELQECDEDEEDANDTVPESLQPVQPVQSETPLESVPEVAEVAEPTNPIKPTEPTEPAESAKPSEPSELREPLGTDSKEIEKTTTSITRPSLSRNISQEQDPCFMHSLKQIQDAVTEARSRLEETQSEIRGFQRTFVHLKMLAPLTQRSRETLAFAAGRYSSKCETAFDEETRLLAYVDVLEYLRSRAYRILKRNNS